MNEQLKAFAVAGGLNEEEIAKILGFIGRDPTIAEIAAFSAMWNEHVSYKSSRKYLKTFPTRGPRVLVGPGENAGVVDVGDGWAISFKMESHNHPSYIEPFQGAATGVGGILRDIFTMGARPIANMDSLRFGSLSHPRTRYLVNGVVAGISYYGNCMGVPTIGGELVFDPTYDGNCLINVFTLGVVKADGVFYGKAAGVGNPVIYMGPATGRDGMGGASMASAAFDEKAAEKRPTVQVGDAFCEKVVLECTLELMKSGLVLGIQDMGAAGLTCSTFEMADRAKMGMKVDLSKVPQRAANMTPQEILLSESQERMLLVCERGNEEGVLEICRKWDIPGAVIGEVTDTRQMEMWFNGEKVVDLPINLLTDEAPLYDRPWAEPAGLAERWKVPAFTVGDLKDEFLGLIDDPSFRSKAPVFQKYDHMVQLRTVVRPGDGDAAVMRLLETGTNRGVAMTSDGNSPACWLHPYNGAFNIIAEACLNLACVGARGIALTDCLNFGNPERPDVMWEFKEVVAGLSEACIAFDTPVTGGNVSFYNETAGTSIQPTPVVGVVGLVEDCDRVAGTFFTREDEAIVLLGCEDFSFDASLYARLKTGKVCGFVRKADAKRHSALCELIVRGIEKGIVTAAHDVSEGGLLWAIAESVVGNGVGATLDNVGTEPAELFGEAPSMAFVTVPEADLSCLTLMAEELGVQAVRIGTTGGDTLNVKGAFTVPVADLTAASRKPL
ncbi:MAG TPA: phosphoribosylformylglycinamidine synthase subunit PurL [Myxococcota bacterium]|nr:phosphoribosylformylglycinamidine synthase subunit PurL [Myxococcota bacterium]HOH76766.1 phosphoribosylformylglycinamidine synthase subunit PurL [Myxococcota bacterium]